MLICRAKLYKGLLCMGLQCGRSETCMRGVVVIKAMCIFLIGHVCFFHCIDVKVCLVCLVQCFRPYY